MQEAMELRRGKKNHTPHHVQNHLFAGHYNYDGNYEVETEVLLIQYNAGNLQFRELTGSTSGWNELCLVDHTNWFDIKGLNDTRFIHNLIEELDFFAVDAKAILTPCHAAKIDYYENRLIMVIRPSFFDKDDISSEHICILAKGNLIITFRERGIISFDNAIKALRLNTMQVRGNEKGMLLAFIINSILSVMIGTAIKMEEMLGTIDRLLLEETPADNGVGRKIQGCSYANLYLQKSAVPLKDEFDKLLDIPLIKENKNLMPVYKELYNQLDYILLTARNCKELLSSLRDLYVSNNELKTNSIMKRLTVVATLFIPISFLVGLWGMNFEFMPEVKLKYGYFLAWGIILSTVLLTWFLMKKNKWF